MKIGSDLQPNNYNLLVEQIGDLLTLSREKVAKSVNTILVQTYWEIGRYIVEFEQNGNEKAVYGTALFERLSKDLTFAYGKGFGRSNLLYMRKLYLTFPKSGTLSHQLTWSHYYEILKADTELEIGFYVKQTQKEKWSARELKRQMKSMLFHRLALSSDKEGVLKLATDGHGIEQAGTSIGANINEAQAGQSKNDLISKMSIASKEARETKYWIDLLVETHYLNISEKYVQSIINDIEEIIKIITSIVKSTQVNK